MSGEQTVTEIQRGIDDYHREGFAEMKGIFSANEIADVKHLVEPLFDNFDSKLNSKIRDVGAIDGLMPGSQQPEIDRATMLEPALLESAVYKRVRDIASSLLGRRARYVFDHFICKMPHTETSTAWHQDRGYMKANTELNTINFWIPMQAVSTENGTLNYVPRSHKGALLEHGRDPELHPHVLTAKVDTANVYSPSLNIGDVCFHHPLTIHSAGPNSTDKIRLAWSIHFGAYGRLEYLKPSNLFNIFKRGLLKA